MNIEEAAVLSISPRSTATKWLRRGKPHGVPPVTEIDPYTAPPKPPVPPPSVIGEVHTAEEWDTAELQAELERIKGEAEALAYRCALRLGELNRKQEESE